MYMCRHTSMDRWRPIVLLHYWRGGGGGYVGKDGYEARDELHTICGTQPYTTQNGRRASVSRWWSLTRTR